MRTFGYIVLLVFLIGSTRDLAISAGSVLLLMSIVGVMNISSDGGPSVDDTRIVWAIPIVGGSVGLMLLGLPVIAAWLVACAGVATWAAFGLPYLTGLRRGSPAAGLGTYAEEQGDGQAYGRDTYSVFGSGDRGAYSADGDWISFSDGTSERTGPGGSFHSHGGGWVEQDDRRDTWD
jgi:hypothetical protein